MLCMGENGVREMCVHVYMCTCACMYVCTYKLNIMLGCFGAVGT